MLRKAWQCREGEGRTACVRVVDDRRRLDVLGDGLLVRGDDLAVGDARGVAREDARGKVGRARDDVAVREGDDGPDRDGGVLRRTRRGREGVSRGRDDGVRRERLTRIIWICLPSEEGQFVSGPS